MPEPDERLAPAPPEVPLGNAEAGAAASLFGLRASVVSGGVLCVLSVAVTAAALPAFWSYDARAPVEG